MIRVNPTVWLILIVYIESTEKSGQLKCGGCGVDRCNAPISGMPNSRPKACDDTTRCGACELVLCVACDDRKHKCCCCDEVFCDGCVGKSAAAQSQLCAFCEEEAYGECVSFTCSECDQKGCEGCRDDYTDACATCNKQICRECREEQDEEPGQSASSRGSNPHPHPHPHPRPHPRPRPHPHPHPNSGVAAFFVNWSGFLVLGACSALTHTVPTMTILTMTMRTSLP